MSHDKTASERVRRQRKQRLQENWSEVKVWVPTKKDAEDIRNIAATRRANAESLEGLSVMIESVDFEMQKQIADAIAQQGSDAYITPSGAVLELLTKLSDEGDLQGFSNAVKIFSRAKPANATFVEAAIPAKIANYWCKHRKISPKALHLWTQQTPGWSEKLKQVARNPAKFETVVNEFEENIRNRNETEMT